LFDDKNLSLGDELILQNRDTEENFARALIVGVKEKKMSEITETDFEGHETYSNTEEMYEAHRGYYGNKVGPNSVIKMIDFRLHD